MVSNMKSNRASYISFYHTSDSYECVRVIVKAVQLCAVYKKLYFFTTSHVRIYQ